MACGRPDIDRFLDELEWSQLQELRAFAAIEGFGDDRQDARFAWLFATLCRKIGIEADPEEFLYLQPDEDDADDDRDEMTPEQTAAAIAAALGAQRI